MSDIFPLESLNGSLSETVQLVGTLSNYRTYTGPTVFRPYNEDWTIFTGGYYVPGNLLIKAIDYREEDNEQGGKTSYIGGV